MQCTYCGQKATERIPSIPTDVCGAHAAEFWSGLIAYAKDRSDVVEPDNAPCLCWTCNQLSASRTHPAGAVAPALALVAV